MSELASNLCAMHLRGRVNRNTRRDPQRAPARRSGLTEIRATFHAPASTRQSGVRPGVRPRVALVPGRPGLTGRPNRDAVRVTSARAHAFVKAAPPPGQHWPSCLAPEAPEAVQTTPSRSHGCGADPPSRRSRLPAAARLRAVSPRVRGGEENETLTARYTPGCLRARTARERYAIALSKSPRAAAISPASISGAGASAAPAVFGENSGCFIDSSESSSLTRASSVSAASMRPVATSDSPRA